ncbi:MAG: hypothetical protein DWQ07_04845 [Chloroflexi bacterium]|nr:MAG: hypothetical protein DWQ07_04845 [Chloroflexota bacterium]MBL1194759.1 hypothetical protein [Chloroflexota bacterium]NOH12051.1 hypothetical protein [Chloroflexota bacterium]
MNRSMQISIPMLIGVIAALLLLLAGVLNSGYVDIIPLDNYPLLDLVGLILVGLIFVAFRNGPKLSKEDGDWRRFIPATPWGMFSIGAFLGMGAVGLVPMFVETNVASQTVVGTWLYPDEIAGTIVGTVLGITIALLIDSRLAAGFLFGFAIGMPSGLLITNPRIHDLFWTYGGFMAYFGILGLVHWYVMPSLLSGIRRSD